MPPAAVNVSGPHSLPVWAKAAGALLGIQRFLKNFVRVPILSPGGISLWQGVDISIGAR